MAQINIMYTKRIEKQRNTVHEKVSATYTTFESDGKKYVQLDTYGRIGRDNPEKISQSFQVDEEVAKYIITLLKKEFEL